MSTCSPLLNPFCGHLSFFLSFFLLLPGLLNLQDLLVSLALLVIHDLLCIYLVLLVLLVLVLVLLLIVRRLAKVTLVSTEIIITVVLEPLACVSWNLCLWFWRNWCLNTSIEVLISAKNFLWFPNHLVKFALNLRQWWELIHYQTGSFPWNIRIFIILSNFLSISPLSYW